MATPCLSASNPAEVTVTYLADTPEVIPLIAKWQHKQWGDLPGARTLDQISKQLHAHLQRDAMPTTFVARVQHQPVGCASLVASDMKALPQWIPWLSSVLVVPQMRGQGVGTRLVECVAAKAVELGYPRLYLYTLDQMHFYQQLRWQISHVRFYRDHNMTVMTRDLIVNPPLYRATETPVASLQAG
jgi:N-acetylglutamate synthase-like GNAT family acetyltransferase